MKFTETTRSERYYTALLLPHLLMSNNFWGLRRLFQQRGIREQQEGDALDLEDLEIVAELNPIRQLGRLEEGETDSEDSYPERRGIIYLTTHEDRTTTFVRSIG